jgi:hypothetical protein
MSFKSIAYQILKEANKPLHSKELTKIAIQRGLLETAGKTPEATMNAQLIVDINTKKDKSLFIKSGPSIFALNPNAPIISKPQKSEQLEETYKISERLSTKQKGDIAEARIAELITLYGEKQLSCYKPISDDEGIDLIVKEKGTLKTIYIQVKSRFGNNPKLIYTATTKANTVIDKFSMALVFCFFDTNKGDVWDYVWFIPAPDFIKKANKLASGLLGFVAGRKKKESNKWDDYLIDKRNLANEIIKLMGKL